MQLNSLAVSDKTKMIIKLRKLKKVFLTHQRHRDARSSERCAEQVTLLVDQSHLNCRPHELLHEMVFNIFDYDIGCADFHCLCWYLLIILIVSSTISQPHLVFCRLEIFFLPHVSHEANHFVSLLQKPFQDAARIESTRVCQQNFFLFHLRSDRD